MVNSYSNEHQKLLHAKYQEEWDTLLANLSAIKSCDQKPTNPLLLDVSPDYWEADYKVMIFGQETNDWGNVFAQHFGINDLLKIYRDFYNNGGYRQWGGQFWNGVSELKRVLTNKLKHKKVGFIWNNLIKIGKAKEDGNAAKGLPCNEILDWQKKLVECSKV